MKSILVFLLLIGSISLGFSQSLERTVIGNAGGLSLNSTAQLEFTVGEVAVSSAKKSSVMLTEGFNQGYIAKKDTQGSIASSIIALRANVYPNPATSLLYVQNNEHRAIRLCVFDYVGKQTLPETMVSANATASIDIHQLPSGVYLIQLTDDHQRTYTHRWIKQ